MSGVTPPRIVTSFGGAGASARAAMAAMLSRATWAERHSASKLAWAARPTHESSPSPLARRDHVPAIADQYARVWSSVTKSPLPETLEQFTRREAALRENAKKVAAVHEQRVTAEARLKELAPLVKAARDGWWPGDAQARAPVEDLPIVLAGPGDTIAGPGPTIAERWIAVRERWSQLTFYLLDAESWR